MCQNSSRSEILKTMIDKYRADGVIDVVLSVCHTYVIETTTIKKTVTEAGYMSLKTDYSKQDSGQIRTKIEAFVNLTKFQMSNSVLVVF